MTCRRTRRAVPGRAFRHYRNVIGFQLQGPDNGSYRFGGDMEPPRCPSCGLVTDRTWVDPSLRVSRRRCDFSYTYDGGAVVSTRLAAVVRDVAGAVLVRLPGDPEFWLLDATQVVEFDAEARQTRFGPRCPTCDRPESVAGATPVMLRSSDLPHGLSRTDVEFGTGDEQHPLLLVDSSTAALLGQQSFACLDLLEIHER